MDEQSVTPPASDGGAAVDPSAGAVAPDMSAVPTPAVDSTPAAAPPVEEPMMPPLDNGMPSGDAMLAAMPALPEEADAPAPVAGAMPAAPMPEEPSVDDAPAPTDTSDPTPTDSAI